MRVESIYTWLLICLLTPAAALGTPRPDPLEAVTSAAARPPRLCSSPRFFAREIRPVQPRSSVGIFTAHIWGSDIEGVRQRQWTTGITAELALGRFGGFFEVPVVWDSAETEGVYGEGSASELGVGDLRFGLDMVLRSFRWGGMNWQVGMGLQVAAPTSEDRQIEPDTPYLAVPPVEVGSARWTLSHGPALAVSRPQWGLSAQLNAGLSVQVQSGGLPWHRNPHLFGDVDLALIYEPLGWLAPMLLWGFQFELYGAPELRQLIFVSPGLRLKPHPRVSVDLGLRIPIREESRAEHRLSMGVVVSLELGSFFSAPQNKSAPAGGNR